LTVILAFSNYAGTRNGELDVSSKTAIVTISNNTLELANIKELRCDWLLTPSQVTQNEAGTSSLTGCENVQALVYSSGSVEASGESLEGTILTLSEALEAGTAVNSVEIMIPDFGFAQEIKVVSAVGNVVELERPPAGTPDLQSIRISLTGSALERRIEKIEGNTVYLDEALPADGTYSSIARFNKFQYVGLDQFRIIMGEAQKALLPVFAWNMIFGILTVLINTIIVVFIALLDLPVFDWLGDCTLAKGAVLLVNLWLGLPFMITATLGALSAIPRDLYEATKMDGANPWQSFWGVTAPLLRNALIPITLTGFAFNFNNFNIIYLLTDGGPPASWGTSTARCTDILISWAYNEAFRSQGGYAYGLGAAISIIIFVITIAVSLMNFQVTGALKEEKA